jgi:predicted enzyme related to lactoylglutathione lyase
LVAARKITYSQPWKKAAFAPLPETSRYFGDATKDWMLNFRVQYLDKMAAKLQTAGIEIKVHPQTFPTRRFAHLHDPEGNPIELRQAKVAETKG